MAAPTLAVYVDTKGPGACRSCHAPITWYELTSGKRHPFEGDPVLLQTSHEATTMRLIGNIHRDDSHFAHCPDAKNWSRKPAPGARS